MGVGGGSRPVPADSSLGAGLSADAAVRWSFGSERLREVLTLLLAGPAAVCDFLTEHGLLRPMAAGVAGQLLLDRLSIGNPSVPDGVHPAPEKGFPSSRPRLKASRLTLKEGSPYGTPNHHHCSHPPFRRRVRLLPPSLRPTIHCCYRRGSSRGC